MEEGAEAARGENEVRRFSKPEHHPTKAEPAGDLGELQEQGGAPAMADHPAFIALAKGLHRSSCRASHAARLGPVPQAP